jgi:hypothetical protein
MHEHDERPSGEVKFNRPFSGDGIRYSRPPLPEGKVFTLDEFSGRPGDDTPEAIIDALGTTGEEAYITQHGQFRALITPVDGSEVLPDEIRERLAARPIFDTGGNPDTAPGNNISDVVPPATPFIPHKKQ